MDGRRTRVLLADDHRLVAEGIRELLATRHEVIGIASDGHSLIATALAEVPDVVLADISMPGLDGLAATRHLRGKLPGVPVILLTMHDDAGHVKAAFEAGAAGYLVKSSAPRELFTAIEEVLAGRSYVTPALAAKALGFSHPRDPEPDAAALSPRESEVATLVGRGLSNAEIAAALGIAEVTVRTHYHRVLDKLGLRNRVELARYAISQGLASVAKEPPAP